MLETLNFNVFSDQTSIRSGYVFENFFSTGLQVPWGRTIVYVPLTSQWGSGQACYTAGQIRLNF